VTIVLSLRLMSISLFNLAVHVAIVGILLGFFPSLYAQITCHFVTGGTLIGDDGVEIEAHYGLWQYTPIDSSFQGLSYCQNYDYGYISSYPIIPRLAGLVAFTCGTIPLMVIWVYLHLQMTHEICWTWSIKMLLIACGCQVSTFLMFAMGVCSGNECSLGPGGKASVISASAWLVLAIEMKRNSPICPTVIRPGRGVVVIQKESTNYLSEAMKQWRKLAGQGSGEDAWDAVPSLSRAAMKKKERVVVLDEVGPSQARSSYKPPPLEIV
jgi:hypothetical protein